MAARKPKMVIERSEKDGQFYWHLLAGNGRIIADGEGFARKAGAVQSAKKVLAAAAAAELVVN